MNHGVQNDNNQLILPDHSLAEERFLTLTLLYNSPSFHVFAVCREDLLKNAEGATKVSSGGREERTEERIIRQIADEVGNLGTTLPKNHSKPR